MPFNGSGTASPPNPPTFPAVSGQTIEAAKFNAIINDIYACLSQSVARDGQSTISSLTMNGLSVATAVALAAGSTIGGLTPIFSRYTTGEVITSVSSTAPAGTLALDGKTLGSAASGATGLASSTAQALFELLWDSSSNALLPIQDASGAATARGASAAADFAANKRLPLPNPSDGDALLIARTSTVLTRSAGEVLAHTHGVTDPGHAHGYSQPSTVGGSQGVGPNDSRTEISVGATWPNLTSISINSSGGAANKAAGLFLYAYIAL